MCKLNCCLHMFTQCYVTALLLLIETTFKSLSVFHCYEDFVMPREKLKIHSFWLKLIVTCNYTQNIGMVL